MKDFEEKLRDLVWSLIEEKVIEQIKYQVEGSNPQNILETSDFLEKVDEMIGDYIRYNVNVSLDC